MSIKENLNRIKADLPGQVSLVAVSKTKSPEEIMEAYKAGHRDFGENKVQEMIEKYELLPKDIRWHMIGHLQRNKVKYLAPFVNLIHGVDSLRLLREINKQAMKNGRIIPCLLQVHIAKEETKFGLSEEELEAVLNTPDLENVKLVGLMGMATFTEDVKQVHKEFAYLKALYDRISQSRPEFAILSMGMSGDFQTAIEEGSTMVRIGSSIFGARNP